MAKWWDLKGQAKEDENVYKENARKYKCKECNKLMRFSVELFTGGIYMCKNIQCKNEGLIRMDPDYLEEEE